MSYKTTEVQVKKPSGGLETRYIRRLSSQLWQVMNERVKHNLRSLSGLKIAGLQIGSLNYVSRISSIPLTQYGGTNRIDENRLKIQGIERSLVVRGIEQIPDEAERTSARLLKRGKDYFLHLTCFLSRPVDKSLKSAIGIDFGIRRQSAFSNGVALKIDVPLTARARRLHRELSRRTKGGKNWLKTRASLNNELPRITNRRLDVRHKILSYLTSNYDCIATQRDTISGWQRLWGLILSTAV